MTDHTTAYTGAAVFDGYSRRSGYALVVEAGRVKAVCPEAELAPDLPREVLDGGVLVPGLVDLQVNGGGGVMLNNQPDPGAIGTICAAHAGRGTTALLPTLISDRPEIVGATVEAADDALRAGVPGAVGLHLEGPHLSVARKGAHDPQVIRPMSEADCSALADLAGRIPALMLTVAPESVSDAQIARLSEAGAVVSLGHTDCSFATAKSAAQAGARCVTHLFNAMSQLGNREPGLVGAALEVGCLNAGLIADGFHSDPASIRIAMRSKAGPGRIFLVSDAMATIGSEITEFELNGRVIYRKGGRLTLADGTLAGADIDLISAVRFMVGTVGLDADEALRMATRYPAELMGLSDQVGTLQPGTRADFLHLDEDLQVKQVWRNGQVLGDQAPLS